MNLWHKNSSPESAFFLPIALQAKVTNAWGPAKRLAVLKQFIIHAPSGKTGCREKPINH